MAAAGAAAALLAGEACARWGLGLGTPPLFEGHPAVEYRYRPDQDLRRFGRRFRTNAFGMRSAEWRSRRGSPAERRVLVMGDSVVAGGSLVDQSELATERLAVSLGDALGVPVRVGNAATPSWGPPNLLAWAGAYGWMDADVVVVVVSSHDAGDAPTGQSLEERPMRLHPPASALLEGLVDYLPRLFAAPRPTADAAAPPLRTRALDDFERLVASASRGGRTVLVALHRALSELDGDEPPGLQALRERARAGAATIVPLAPAFRAALEAGDTPYRDDLHPTPRGQAAIAEALEGPLRSALGGS